MKLTMLHRKVIAVVASILLLSLGWLGITGLPLLVALVPLFWISGVAEDSRRGWWGVFGWALLCFLGWNISTIWWIGYATPVGPIAATIISSFYSMVAFMLFHTVSRKAPKALAYTLFVAVWIALEYYYMRSDVSWPWLFLGNGFSNDIWAVQWYEYTGLFGGTLWVLVTNILFYEAYRSGRGWWRGGVAVAAPLALSLVIYFSYDPLVGEDGEPAPTLEVSVVQPNVDCYDKFSGVIDDQERLLLNLAKRAPRTTDLILYPETAIPRVSLIGSLNNSNFVCRMRDTMKLYTPEARLVSGVSTMEVYYDPESRSETARKTKYFNHYHDVYNSALVMNNEQVLDLRHKAKLVIGVENTPSLVFKIFRFFVIDLGGVVGQLGKGDSAEAFEFGGHKVGAAICYEGLYGDFYGGFVRDGAEMMTIISNDGWWRDTPGYRHLYSMSRLRAVEHRRAIARSANTGTSGFINSRGDSVESLGWDERGVITRDVALHNNMTIYTLWGDYIARIAVYIALLSLLYFVAYRARRRHHLV